jgi:hypothetical protein
MRKLLFIMSLLVLLPGTSLFSTPSTLIWIPSTDFQGFGKIHLGFDNFLRMKNINNTRGGTIFCAGITSGILPFKKFQGEIGIDYFTMSDPVFDRHPILFNFKIGMPEDALFKNSPAIAIGAYNVGIKKGLTNYNMLYGLVAKTLPIIGRISLGYYYGNKNLLLDQSGNVKNQGLLLSWDRSLTEISDKLWMAVDYQGGKNSFGSVNIGLSWAFTKNISVLLGYDIWNNRNVLYDSKDPNSNSVTIQVDINF